MAELGGKGSQLDLRAGYTLNHVWVTPTAREERWPAGDYVNQSEPGEGLPRWTEADRSVADRPITLWHIFGHHHIVRPEDFPELRLHAAAACLFRPQSDARCTADGEAPELLRVIHSGGPRKVLKFAFRTDLGYPASQGTGSRQMDLQFGSYCLKRAERLLLGPEGPVELSARSFDILAKLLERPEEVVGKTEIFDAVWPGMVVEENTLQVHISALRKALDTGMITTVHGRGYKYAGPRPVAAAPAANKVAPPTKPSIAVLPFANLSGDAAQDIFCEGLALNIVASLGRYHELFVIDRFSTLAYRNRTVTSAEAARELSVRYILEGSVQKAGDRIRVSVQLVDGVDNRQLWTETYDRQLTDIFAVQDEITGTIIGTLASGYGGRLGKAWRDRTKSAGLESFVALDHLQRALDTCRFTKEGEIRAREDLMRAIEYDPRLAKAHSKMALSHILDAYCGWADDYDVSMELARRWAMKAIACDDGESWSYWAFGCFNLYAFNHVVALEAFRKGLDCNPNDAEVMTDYGLCLSYAGRAEEGIEYALKAMRLNPYHYEWYTAQLGQIYFDARQYDKAIAAFASLRSLDSALMRVYQAASFAAAGNEQQAQKSVKRALELDAGATLEKWTDPKLAPYGDVAYLEHFRQNLRKARLPERAARIPKA